MSVFRHASLISQQILLVLCVFIACLLVTSNTVAAATFDRALIPGSTGPDVAQLQQILTGQGDYTYPQITGYYGMLTKQAVVAFQTANGLEPIGSVGPKTRELLNSLATEAASSGNNQNSQPIVLIISSPSTITGNQTAYVIWASSGAASCMASGSWQGERPTVGWQAVSPTSSGNTYSITCSNSAGSQTKSVTILNSASVAGGGSQVSYYGGEGGGTTSTGGSTSGGSGGDSTIPSPGTATTTPNATTTPTQSTISVSLTTPLANATLSGTVGIQATASSSLPTGVQFFVDNTPIAPEIAAPPYAFSWDTTNITDGTHILLAVAQNAQGSATSTPIPVTVQQPIAQSPGTLVAIPSASIPDINLSWGINIPSAVSIERWADGAATTTIATVTDRTTYTDTTAQANTIYYYDVANGSARTNAAIGVSSDITKPFICPAIAPVPDSMLGVDRTESFVNPSGQTVSFTIRAPIPMPTVITVEPCGSQSECSDYANINSAITKVIAAGGGTVQLDSGDYYLTHAGAKFANISIGHAEDLILTGTGQDAHGTPLTHLYFSNQSSTTSSQGFNINSGNRVLIKNLMIDWDMPNAVPGIVHTVGSEQHLVIQDPSYYVPDPKNPPRVLDATGYNFATRTFTQIDGARLGVAAKFNPNFSTDGQYYYKLGGKFFIDGAQAIVYEPTGAAFNIARTNDLSLENIKIFGGGGPGFVTSQGSRDLRISNLQITRKPDYLLRPGERPRYFALIGDSDANQSGGNILIENSEFGYIDDDTFYDRGYAGPVASVDSATEVTVKDNFSPAPVSGTTDDNLLFVDPVTLAPISSITPTVTSSKVTVSNGTVTWVVQFSPAIPQLLSYQGRPASQLPIVSEPTYSGPNFVIRNICAHDNHGRVFSQASNGLIEDSVFGNSYFGPIELTSSPSFMHDGFGPQNIIIRNNRIVGAVYGSTDTDWTGRFEGYQTGWASAAMKIGATGSNGFVTDDNPMAHIQIVNNFIENTPGLGITLFSTNDATISGNTLVNTNTVPFYPNFNALYCGAKSQPFGQKYGVNQPWCSPKVAASGSIMVAHSSNVRISGNTFLGSSQGVFVDPSSTSGITQ